MRIHLKRRLKFKAASRTWTSLKSWTSQATNPTRKPERQKDRKTEKSDKAKAKRYMATGQSIPPLLRIPAMVLQVAPNTKAVEEFAQAEAWMLLTALGPTKRWLAHLTQQHAELKASGLLGQMTPDLKTAGALSNFLGASAISVYKRRQAMTQKSSPRLSAVSDPSLAQESDDAGGDASP